MSNHEVCLTFSLLAGDLMAVGDWMSVPVIVTVVILGWNKVKVILEARERQR